MNTKMIYPLMVCLFLWMQVSAITLPLPSTPPTGFGDTSLNKLTGYSDSPAAKKKTGFFAKVKNKLAKLILQRQMRAGAKASIKSILGWVSLGLVVLGIGLLLFSSGGGAAGAFVVFCAGLLTGIAALVWPRTQADKEQKKNRNTGALIGIILGVGFVVAVVIALSGLGHR